MQLDPLTLNANPEVLAADSGLVVMLPKLAVVSPEHGSLNPQASIPKLCILP